MTCTDEAGGILGPEQDQMDHISCRRARGGDGAGKTVMNARLNGHSRTTGVGKAGRGEGRGDDVQRLTWRGLYRKGKF